MEQRHPLIIMGLILGASLVLSVMLGALTVFRIRAQNDIVSVTGSAKMEVTADQSKWTTQITRTVRESALKSGYDQLTRDLELTRAYLKGQGIAESEMIVSPITMNEQYRQDQSTEKMYTLFQTITMQSPDVDRLASASKNVASLVSQGVIFSTISLEYYYSKLPEARIQLLSLAIEDAKARAAELAKNSGRGVGTLKSASSGVVQVQSRNSTDVSDYGSYDTSQVEKQITVTVKASFSLR